ncbi:MAG: Hsp20/alpha crystallin family protein [Planctomycetota bacterium]
MMLARRNIFDPFAALEREFAPVTCRSAESTTRVGLPIHVWEQEESFIAEADLPGLGPEDITIEVLGRTVRIRAERDASSGDAEGEGEPTPSRTRRSIRAVREFVVPRAIDAEKVSATLDRGVLTLTVPKAESERPRQIPVQAGS